MSFTLALLILVAVGAIAVGLICVHLLARLELIERAVQGGLDAPTTRLTREQFERRFGVAHARAALAASVVTGVVIVFGPEVGANHELVRILAHLSRRDQVFVTFTPDNPAGDIGLDDFGRPDMIVDTTALGVTTTPFAFVVDDARIRAAQPLVSGDALLSLLREQA